MRAPIYRDHSLPSLTLARFVEDRYRTWRLDDPLESAEETAAEVGKHAGHAAFGHAAVLWTVGAVETARVVEGRHIGSPRGRRAILASRTTAFLALARVRGLQKRELKGPL